MAEKIPQTFANHAKLVPGYHYVLALLLVINLGWQGWTLFRSPSLGSVIGLTTAFAILMIAFYARVFPLQAQDRLIRLEERLRMQRLLPDDLPSRVESLTPGQMVALRFASDEELADLTRQVLDEGIEDRTEIKKRIRTWRADIHRL